MAEPQPPIGLSPERYIEGTLDGLQKSLTGYRKGMLTDGDLYARLTVAIALLELAQSNLQVLIDATAQAVPPKLEGERDG